jgi:uncharacterized protein
MNIYKRIVRYSLRHSRMIVVFTFALTAVMTFYAVQVKLNPDVNSLLPAEDPSNVSFNDYFNKGEYTDNFMFMIEGDDLYSPGNLAAIHSVVLQIERLDNITTGVHPFSFITAQKKGTRLALTPISVVKDERPWTQEEADEFKRLLLSDDLAKNLIVSEDGRSMLFFFPAVLLPDENQQQVRELQEMLKPLERFAEVYVNGGLFFTDRVLYYLQSDIVLLLSLCFIIILAIYYISFKAKRAVLLPMSVVLFGTIWSLGIVTLLGFELTVIHIITPALVLTLGSSYSIHLLSDYYRTHPKLLEKNDKEWIPEVVSHVTRTIVVAGLTTVAGFLSLLVTRIAAFRQFGIATSIGILACVLLTLFYMPAMLNILPNPAVHYYTMVVGGRLSLLVKKLAKSVVSRWYIYLAVFLLAIGGFLYSYPRVTFDTNYTKYYPKNELAITNLSRIVQNIGGVDAINITIDAPEGADRYFLDTDVLSQVEEFETALIEATPEITHSLSFVQYIKFFNRLMSGNSEMPETPGLVMLLSRYFRLMSEYSAGNNDLELLISEDSNSITIAYRYANPDRRTLAELKVSQKVTDSIEEYAQLYLPEECSYTVWGQVNRMISLSGLIEKDQRDSTILSILIVLLITSITFKSLKFGVLSLLPILFGIMTNYIFMHLFKIPFDTVTIAFASVTVGVGIDDAVHFILRFRSLYHYRPGGLKPAVKRTMELTGRPIILTTVSIIAGLMVFTLAKFVPIRYFGILISIALLNTLLATLFILPSGIILWISTERLIQKRRKRRAEADG